MTRYQPLTATAVHDAAAFESVRTGTVTTLDVKRRLRDRGYWAVQDEVSLYLARVAAAHGWPWWEMGGFRLYAVPRGGGRGERLSARRAREN